MAYQPSPGELGVLMSRTVMSRSLAGALTLEALFKVLCALSLRAPGAGSQTTLTGQRQPSFLLLPALLGQCRGEAAKPAARVGAPGTPLASSLSRIRPGLSILP